MKVCDLTPGTRVTNSGNTWVFIGQMPHPLFAGFQLVIWWKDGPELDLYSFDALRSRQALPGDIEPSTDKTLRKNLMRALIPGARSRPS